MKKLLLFTTLILVTFSFAQAPTNGLIAYFEFDNTLNSSTSSDVFVNTGNNNATFVTTGHGQGVSFNGETTLQIPSLSEPISSLTNSFTISWWEFRPAATPQLDTYSVRVGQNVGFRYIGNSTCTGIFSDRYQIDITTNTNTYHCVTTNTHTGGNGGTWKHHTISKLNNVLKYYLNGVLAFVGTSGRVLDAASLSATTTNLLELGYGGGTFGSNMIGTIDDLAIYKRQLSAGEIATIYQSGNSGALASIIDIGDFSTSSSSQKISYSIYGHGNTTTKVYYGTTNPPTTASSFVVGPNATNIVLYEKLNTTITGLTPGVQYYYRIEAVNDQGSNFSIQPTYSFIAGGSNNPLLNFPFDGNTNSSNNSYTLNPLSTAPTYVSNRMGQANKAIYLNNKTLSADIPVLPVASSARTVSFWMKHLSQTNNNVYGWGTFTNNYSFGCNSNPGVNSLTIYGGPTGLGYNTPVNYDNNWHHYAISYDGAQIIVYLDGIYQTYYPSNLSTQGTILYIGGQTGNSTTAETNIHLDDFQVYNQAFNREGIYGLYLSQSATTLHSQDFNAQNLKATIYPNPTTDSFSIEMESDLKSVEIYSLQGQKVMTSFDKNVNVSNLSNGMYLVRIEDSNNAISTQKLIVK